MRRIVFKFSILAVMLTGLPLAGALMADHPAARYLEFPPQTAYVRHAPFSWTAFALYGGFILAVIAGIAFLARHSQPETFPKHRLRPFPWWGWAGVGLGAGTWILAWTRFTWFAALQPHTFFPLWLAFIITVNGLGFRRSGHAMIIDRPRFFLALFPASAAFWWFFEYLNRFVQNWFYTGSNYSPGLYFLLATLSFSTVLPAVLAVREWVFGATWLQTRFAGVRPLAPSRPKALAAAILAVASVGLAGIGIWPDLLFPLLWVSPLLILVSLQAMAGEPHALSTVAIGDWRPVIAASTAALVCGFFWEMWNFFSLARWTYQVPLVHRFQIFEMPVLGYAGYLPFGLECMALAGLVETLIDPSRPAAHPES
ncbi:MAG: hypothetical protein JEZ11_06045 [Desulfobacterales bacterium]|nr:hypothetical protein [Desulfobacterales bacterium]